MTRHLSRIFSLSIILLLLTVSPLWAQLRVEPVPGQPAPPGPKPRVGLTKSGQQVEEQLLADRARRAEMSGDYGRALQMWNELLKRSPWHAEAIQAIPRILTVEKEFNAADSFLVEQLEKIRFRADGFIPAGDPTSAFALKLERGSVALARGESEQAKAIWSAALSEHGRNLETVTAYVREMQSNRMWDESEQAIREFRTDGKQPAFMALELANSLRAQMNYGAATEELLLFADANPQTWQASLTQLQQFPDDSAAHEKVIKTLRSAVQKNKKHAIYWRIYGGYLLKAGELAGSLDATIVADSLTTNGGTLVLGAAQTILDEGEVELARRGFQKVISWKPAADIAARAELGLGRCLESLGKWSEAKGSYEKFIESHPNFKEVDEARIRIANILLEHENRPADALVMFKGLVNRAQQQPYQKVTVGLRIGDCHAWMGEHGPAIEAWGNLVRQTGLNQTEDGARALLRIARANVWRDSLSLAYAALDSITNGNVGTTAFNDAIKFTSLLEEGGVYRAQRAFAEADYATFRNNDSVAATRYHEAVDLVKSGKLAEYCLFMEAMSLRRLGAYTAAVGALDTFAAHFGESTDLDRAKYFRALIRMEDLKDDATARQEFEQFLVDHPRSIYLEQARRKARILAARGSS